jgi:hypothetical protein
MAKSLSRRSVLGALGLAALVAAASFVAMGAARGSEDTNEIQALAFHDQMRKLWEDHITWTRLAIVNVADGAPGTETSLTVGRLLQNQVDIGNAVKPFYGDAGGNALTALLQAHINLAAEILVVAKTGGLQNNPALNDAVVRWYANANDIAAFLHDANPKNWPLNVAQAMLKTHLDLTLKEAVAHLTSDFAGSVVAYDQVHSQILGLADFLSSGIMKQFPKLFEGTDDLLGELAGEAMGPIGA